MKKSLSFLLVFLVFIPLLVVGCSSGSGEIDPGREPVVQNPEDIQLVEDELEEVIPVDLVEIKANELGDIMVLMYHSIGEPEAEWRRTPDNFRADLEYLYNAGYRPISLSDYVTGHITTEAGFTPIVLTFDDGWQDNFNLIKDENGNLLIDPDSAVGILEEFHESHPDFPLKATFFVNDNVPFGQREHLEYKLNYIVELGMDIGNHTATHINFTRQNLDSGTIQKEIATLNKMINRYLPEYTVNTLALPFGSRPRDKELYKYLETGSYDGTSYKNIAILNVGWQPYKSPYHNDFNPLAIHRVRGSDLQKHVQGVGMYDWLQRFETGERKRYISDGDPNTIAIPTDEANRLNKDRFGDKEIIIYEP